MQEQYETLRDATVTGDIDLLHKVLWDPSSVSFKEQETVARKLGFKKGLLAAATNLIADPMVWMSMFLSAKFPTTALMSGMIPHRLMGAAAEFAGATRAFDFFRTMSSRYNKTNIPRIVAVTIDRKADVLKLFDRYLKIVKKRPNWQEERYVVAQVLDGHYRPRGVLSHRRFSLPGREPRFAEGPSSIAP